MQKHLNFILKVLKNKINMKKDLFLYILILPCTSLVTTAQIKRINPLFIIDNPKVYTETFVHSISLDSVMVKVIIYNLTDSNFLLYKKLLPSDSLKFDEFSIIADDKTMENVDFIAPVDSNIHLYFTEKIFYHFESKIDRSDLPIIPEQDSQYYVILTKKDSLTFYTNVAKYYDFKSAIKNGHHNFAISYIPMFPYVINYKHVFWYDKLIKRKKPVYLDVCTRKFEGNNIVREKFSFKEK